MRSILFYILLISLVIIPMPCFAVLFVFTTPLDRERRVMHWGERTWSRLMFGINPWWRVRIDGREHLPKGKPVVVVSNHRSMVDIPLVALLPVHFKWVAKQEVYRWPFFGWVLWMGGNIAIERGAAVGARTMLREGLKHLAAGTSIAVFPEGTRSRTGQMGKFREGAFVLAKEAGVDLLPCVVSGTDDVADGWKLRLPHRFTIKILPPIATDTLSPAELAQAAKEAIILNSQFSILNS